MYSLDVKIVSIHKGTFKKESNPS